MTELSPRAKELLRRASRGGGPSERQRDLLKRSVMAAVLMPAVASALTLKLVVTGLIAGAVGAGVTAATLASRRTPTPAAHLALSAPPPPTTAVAEVTEPNPTPPPPVALEATPLPPVVARAPHAVVASSPLPRPREERPSQPAPETAGLALELESLDRAVRAVEAEHFDDGLAEAREFLRAYPTSELATEARVVEVLALCGLSRVDEARALAERLPTAASGNPAVRRLQGSCTQSFTIE